MEFLFYSLAFLAGAFAAYFYLNMGKKPDPVVAQKPKRPYVRKAGTAAKPKSAPKPDTASNAATAAQSASAPTNLNGAP